MVLQFCLPLVPQAKQKPKKGFLFFRMNRFDKAGEYHGRWKVFFGDDEALIHKGRYRHGTAVGTWKYYYPSGVLYMKEKYSRQSNLIRVQIFHENGELAKEGNARMSNSSTVEHYYWFGDWKVYDAQGDYSHTELYEGGNLVGKK